MSALVVLLITVGASAAEQRQLALVPTAVRQALGDDVRVVVEQATSEPDDASAANAGTTLGASVVGELAWRSAARDEARVHLYFADEARWYERTLRFGPHDTLEEKERSLGFVIAAMVRASAAAPPEVPAEPPPVEPVVRLPGPAAVAPPPASEPRPPAHVPDAAPHADGEVFLRGALPVTGEGLSGGPGAVARGALADGVGTHASAAVRFGRFDRDVVTRYVDLAAGFDLDLPKRGAFDVRLGISAGAEQQHVGALSEDRERWVVAVSGRARAVWSTSGLLRPFVALGLTSAPARTRVVLDGRDVGELPTVSASLDLGIAIGR